MAWVGDSVALLVKNGRPHFFMNPHRADREDERNRIEESGGTVVNIDTWRVNGALAVTRAIGDPDFKPYVISDPDIQIVDLDGSEDYIILGCDGVWDSIAPDDACTLVYGYLAEHATSDDDLYNAQQDVSKMLADAAITEGSNDNITSIVVFLRDLKDIIKVAQNCEYADNPSPQFEEKNETGFNISEFTNETENMFSMINNTNSHPHPISLIDETIIKDNKPSDLIPEFTDSVPKSPVSQTMSPQPKSPLATIEEMFPGKSPEPTVQHTIPLEIESQNLDFHMVHTENSLDHFEEKNETGFNINELTNEAENMFSMINNTNSHPHPLSLIDETIIKDNLPTDFISEFTDSVPKSPIIESSLQEAMEPKSPLPSTEEVTKDTSPEPTIQHNPFESETKEIEFHIVQNDNSFQQFESKNETDFNFSEFSNEAENMFSMINNNTNSHPISLIGETIIKDNFQSDFMSELSESVPKSPIIESTLQEPTALEMQLSEVTLTDPPLLEPELSEPKSPLATIEEMSKEKSPEPILQNTSTVTADITSTNLELEPKEIEYKIAQTANSIQQTEVKNGTSSNHCELAPKAPVATSNTRTTTRAPVRKSTASSVTTTKSKTTTPATANSLNNRVPLTSRAPIRKTTLPSTTTKTTAATTTSVTSHTRSTLTTRAPVRKSTVPLTNSKPTSASTTTATAASTTRVATTTRAPLRKSAVSSTTTTTTTRSKTTTTPTAISSNTRSTPSTRTTPTTTTTRPAPLKRSIVPSMLTRSAPSTMTTSNTRVAPATRAPLRKSTVPSTTNKSTPTSTALKSSKTTPKSTPKPAVETCKTIQAPPNNTDKSPQNHKTPRNSLHDELQAAALSQQ